jgi:tetratricopeptide (TPR) repeat protein
MATSIIAMSPSAPMKVRSSAAPAPRPAIATAAARRCKVTTTAASVAVAVSAASFPAIVQRPRSIVVVGARLAGGGLRAAPTRTRATTTKTMAAKGGAGTGSDATPMGPNKTAADAVNNGLACFEKRRYEDAVKNFSAALSAFGAPSEDESRAALYNRACAHVKLQQYDEAKADLTSAVNDYELKFSVVLKDPDMEVFRGTPQYDEMAAEEVKGFRSNKAIASLRAEAQEPFRFLKLYIFGGLAAGATLGLIIILTRLAAALKGGDDAPELGETLINMCVNLGGIGVFGYLLKGELAARDRMNEKVEREEEIGRLRVSTSENSEDVLMSQLRGNYRVFIIAGSEEHVEETVSSLAKYKTMLKENSVIIATVDMQTGGKGGSKKGGGSKKPAPGAKMAALAAEFAAEREAGEGESAGAAGEGEGGSAEEEAAEEAPEIQFGKRSRRVEVAVAAARVTEKRWRVAPVDEAQWRAWVINEVERSGFDTTVRDVFFSVGKDGTLWKSGAGIPNWMKLIEELPTGVAGGLTGL